VSEITLQKTPAISYDDLDSDAYPDMYDPQGRPIAIHEQAFWLRQNDDAAQWGHDNKALLACMSE
jgi:hypothetical protein